MAARATDFHDMKRKDNGSDLIVRNLTTGQMQGQWSQRSGRCGSMSVSSQQVEKGDALPDADAPLSPVRATCDGTLVTFFVDLAAFSRDLGQSKCVTLVP